MRRLEIRGRLDDTPEVIDERLRIYRQEMYPVLNYFNENGVRIAHIDGTGTVGKFTIELWRKLNRAEFNYWQ